MKKPTKSRISGRKYRILFKNRSDLVDRFTGRAVHDNCVITVAKDKPLRSQKETLFHELLHVAGNNGGCDMGENAVVSLSNGFFAILLDNPEMTHWMLE